MIIIDYHLSSLIILISCDPSDFLHRGIKVVLFAETLSYNNIDFPFSLPDTTQKVTTSTLYPTFSRPDIVTPAPHSYLQQEKRSDSKIWPYSNSYFQVFLVTGGYNGREYLSSTELYLPSRTQWTRGGDLPRHSIKILSTIDIILMMIKS